MKGDRSGSRTHFTHAYLWKAAQRCLQRAEKEREGSFYEALLAVVGATFACEAYLNFAGPALVADWTGKDEWLSPKKKLERVGSGAGITIRYSDPPYLTFAQAFHIRNQIAHGRTETVSAEWSFATEGISGASSLDAEWMKACTPSEARIIIDGLESVVRELHVHIEAVQSPFDTLAEGESSGSGGAGV